MAGFLKSAYDAATPEETRALYDAWAGSYDAEVAENGYATPVRVAQALRACGVDPKRPVLDFGCGTGLSGAILKSAGFEVIDGVDVSPEMLARAKAKGVYRQLTQVKPGDTPPAGYATAVAVGVISPSVAPLAALDALLDGLVPGGHLAFSFNDHALEDPTFPAHVAELAESGRAELVFEQYGEHLPGIGMGSTVYVLKKP